MTKPPRGATLKLDHPLARGLVGCWLFNEGAGNIVWDLSPYKNTGKLINGPVWTAGKFGCGLYFDGVDDNVQIPSSEALKPSTFTLIAWVKFNTLTYKNSTIFVKERQWFITVYYTGHIRYWQGDGANWFTPPLATPDGTIVAGNWYQIVAKYDGNNKYIYVNGSLKAGPQAQGFGVNNNLLQLCGRNGTNDWLNGVLDIALIYNRALSEDEIRWLYEDPYDMFEVARPRFSVVAVIPKKRYVGATLVP